MPQRPLFNLPGPPEGGLSTGDDRRLRNREVCTLLGMSRHCSRNGKVDCYRDAIPYGEEEFSLFTSPQTPWDVVQNLPRRSRKRSAFRNQKNRSRGLLGLER